jgi:uncharacterized protein
LTEVKVAARGGWLGSGHQDGRKPKVTHTPHELTREFPQAADRIHALKLSDAHFARLAEEYHEVNRQVHRAETNVEPLDQLTEVALRKQRARLKDEIAVRLARSQEIS